ncbi:unnamed protein product [Cuscuta campestris]|uniref:Uncharacterized protein n=1 Tax=Cuscuta campestris TaxID=132261 RepID=A0A484NAR4_9ASTE|nr:unnamed protein product [Cuscuta campestris]
MSSAKAVLGLEKKAGCWKKLKGTGFMLYKLDLFCLQRSFTNLCSEAEHIIGCSIWRAHSDESSMKMNVDASTGLIHDEFKIRKIQIRKD